MYDIPNASIQLLSDHCVDQHISMSMIKLDSIKLIHNYLKIKAEPLLCCWIFVFSIRRIWNNNSNNSNSKKKLVSVSLQIRFGSCSHSFRIQFYSLEFHFPFSLKRKTIADDISAISIKVLGILIQQLFNLYRNTYASIERNIRKWINTMQPQFLAVPEGFFIRLHKSRFRK